ncbi:MAG: beta-lactamase family protein [Acidobacteria bacterium]|nr:beta-lactamase family protein [Acidobacteriota bacterium]
MTRKLSAALFTLILLLCATCVPSTARRATAQTTAARSGKKAEAVYYPPRGEAAWRRKSPAEAGMDAALLEQAVAYARTQESKVPRDFSTQVETFGAVLGPLPKERGETNGIVIRHGYIVAEWGDTLRVDPTYSVAKSFLSALLGLTIDRGLIKSVKDPVRHYITDGGYDSPHNSAVTWEDHARQTSEWEGVMWGKSHDFIGVEAFGKGRRAPRPLRAPGTYYEYNDVRINRLALSLLRLWRKPLPEVLRAEIMRPIGASDAWRYHGYANSDVVIDGKKMASVSGGTRWGGGLWINTRDEARFGYLFLRGGRWRDRRIISERWVREATAPGKVKADYGYLWWLNTGRKAWPSAPESSYAALGYGSNTIWVDPEHDLVIVWRWHQANPDELIRRVLASIK